MPQVTLAFTPQSNWQQDFGQGANGAVWPATVLSIPPTLFRRRLYLVHNIHPAGNGFNLQGRIIFSLGGQNISEIPYHPGNIGTQTLPSPIAWSGIPGTQPVTANGISVRLGTGVPDNYNLWPVEFVVQADRMELRIDGATNQDPAAGPVWFVGCLSMSLW